LNVGPRPDGTIQPEFAERLREIGRWLSTYGRSIYQTRAGPIPPRPWGATTRRGDTVFVHVLSSPDRVLALPSIGTRVRRAWLLSSGASVTATEAAGGIVLTLPPRGDDEYDQVIVLETVVSGRN
ncbi:MAG TPA: alpha-L-fucosidase, partial [Gemmatimonadaceae bacterium]|nr:alpha-L-fucosidase [Gemmatimonadaceae bacterium]